MNGIQFRKAQNEKQFPGCLGRMVNLLDLGNVVNRNRLLTDKPHNDGSSLSRSCSDLASTLSAQFDDQIRDNMTVSELRRSSSKKKANGTPMKILIAHEMSKEADSRRSPPNVVAKLMGLDTLPHQQHSSATERCHSNAYSMRSLSQSAINYWEHNNYRDISPQKGKSDNDNKRKMALVRQKFMEAKRLATDEKSRQSKEFQDALEVLSSNRDLFLKFLQEPHSLFSQHLFDMQSDIQSVPSPREKKRITVLRPSKAVDSENFVGSRKTGDKYSPTFSNQRFEEYAAQPTRIVVLKPSSPGKTLDKEEYFDELEDEVTEITGQMHTMGHRRDETLLSSVFSNGYIGYDSSFCKSDNDYAVGNLSDSEIMSPISRHSWDYINRSGSPFSSSFSRASCSPESSVCREAKKRLSERWAMMASNGNFSEQNNAGRSSSTLGEMLALSNTKKIAKSKEEGLTKVVRSLSEEENVTGSPKNLVRSKSLPVSSMVYGTGTCVEVSESEAGKTEASKELRKAKSAKSSLKGKVSSLFFSRNKKSMKEKAVASHSKDESQFATPVQLTFPGKSGDDSSQCANNSDLEDCFSPVLSRPSCKTAPTLLKEGVTSVPNPIMSGNISENQDQPSPISVLEPPFEEDDSAIPELSAKIRLNQRGPETPPKSNLIDKSPPIESIARTISWNDSRVETATTSLCTDEEHDWPLLIQALLSEAGLDRWHSPESPLDPALRSKYADLTDKNQILHEAKRRQRRSNRKLVFDFVNAALLEHGMRGTSAAVLVDRVWGQMKEWLYRCNLDDDVDSASLAVDTVVGKEVAGRGWRDDMRVERDSLGIEIEEKLLTELVEDAVVHLSSCV